MVPRLAFDRRDACDLREPIRRRTDERELTFLGYHEQHVLIGENHELTRAVASALPLALAVREIDARENVSVETVRVALVHDEVVEVRLQTIRRPALFDAPSTGSVLDAETADAEAAAHRNRVDEEVAVRRHRGLHDGAALPRVLPQHFAVARRDARRALLCQLDDLLDAVDRHELRGAVAHAGGLPDPAWSSGRAVVRGERACVHDDDVARDHRRAREAPVRNLPAG